MWILFICLSFKTPCSTRLKGHTVCPFTRWGHYLAQAVSVALQQIIPYAVSVQASVYDSFAPILWGRASENDALQQIVRYALSVQASAYDIFAPILWGRASDSVALQQIIRYALSVQASAYDIFAPILCGRASENEAWRVCVIHCMLNLYCSWMLTLQLVHVIMRLLGSKKRSKVSVVDALQILCVRYATQGSNKPLLSDPTESLSPKKNKQDAANIFRSTNGKRTQNGFVSNKQQRNV